MKTLPSFAPKRATDKIIKIIKEAQRLILTAAGTYQMPKFMVVSFYLRFISVYIPVGCIVCL